MRIAHLLCCCLVLATAATAATESAQTADRATRKGDPLTVKGCLSGTSLVATETSAADTTALLAEGLTFRLAGDKALLRQLRQEHDRRLVEVRGILKSNLPQAGAQPRSLGGMRIGIGATAPMTGRPEGEARRVLPVLEVTAFDGGSTFCGR
jgi:hypothetical protein